jgi:hypothetical protein
MGDAIVNHWIEHLAALGAREVDVIAAKGAELVRACVGDGARWGITVRVLAARVEPTAAEAFQQYPRIYGTRWLQAPNDIVLISHLPGCEQFPLFEGYASWFAALEAWMPRALTPTRVRMTQPSPGVWVGSRARVSPSATLRAPCWIGDQAIIEEGATVGPSAIIDDRSVVDRKASVAHSWVGPDTFVGAMTSVRNSIAWASTLTNWNTDSSLLVPDPFLLSSLVKAPSGPSRGRSLSPAPSRTSAGFFGAIRSRLLRGIGLKPARSGGG